MNGVSAGGQLDFTGRQNLFDLNFFIRRISSVRSNRPRQAKLFPQPVKGSVPCCQPLLKLPRVNDRKGDFLCLSCFLQFRSPVLENRWLLKSPDSYSTLFSLSFHFPDVNRAVNVRINKVIVVIVVQMGENSSLCFVITVQIRWFSETCAHPVPTFFFSLVGVEVIRPMVYSGITS